MKTAQDNFGFSLAGRQKAVGTIPSSFRATRPAGDEWGGQFSSLCKILSLLFFFPSLHNINHLSNPY